MPALATTQSIPPWGLSLTASLNKLTCDCQSVTLHSTKWTLFAPAKPLLTSRHSASPFATLMSPTITVAPFFAQSRTKAAPKPLAPPVIRITLPLTQLAS
jgi:hypothetical protein